jgi:glycerol-3-phosphate acyltransferase PlsY
MAAPELRSAAFSDTISAAAVLIIIRHHQNIRRLLSGQEPRFSVGHK